jgi:hypothetical protein
MSGHAEEEWPEPEDGLHHLNRHPPATAVIGRSGQVFQGKSFGCLPPASPLRHGCIRLVEHWLFEPFIALVISA